jgi:GTP-binding protein HflX
VGFIQKLPTDVVVAFRATLEEVTYADLVLQVVDVADPAALDQALTVEAELGELRAADKPRVIALNKVDQLGPAARRRAVQALHARYPDAVAVSAINRSGFEALLSALEAASRDDVVAVDLLVPYGREQVLHDLRQVGGVDRTEYVAAGTRAWGWVPRRALHRFQAYAV